MGNSTPEILIRAGQSTQRYWRDVWLYRELLWFLSWRDVLVRYKQTVIGVAWALIRPFLTLLVFTAVFSFIARMPSVGDVPYAIMVFAGLLPWLFFASTLGEMSSSLLDNERLITKIYFPRILVPLSSILVTLLDFLIAGVLLVGLFFWFGFYPDWRAAFVPMFVLLGFSAALGPGLLVSALNVKFRDFKYVVPFIAHIGLFISPVVYSSSLLPEPWRLLYSLNPMVAVIDGFRWCLLAGQFLFYWPGFVASLAVNLLLLLAGVFYFRRTERSFADVI